jgi:hypothetical protein
VDKIRKKLRVRAESEILQQSDQSLSLTFGQRICGIVHDFLVPRERSGNQRPSCRVSETRRARRSRSSVLRFTRPRFSSRSIAVVMEPLVRLIRRHMSFTRSRPLLSSTSRIVNSDSAIPTASMLSAAYRPTDRYAFMSTSQT